MICIDNVKKSFEIKKVQQTVLNGLSLKIQDSDIIGIMGPSGCGKTTLIRCMVGLDKDFSGKIVYDNKIDVLSKSFKNYRKCISVVFQDYGLFLNKTVQQNILIPLIDVHKLSKEEAIKIANQNLERFGVLEQKEKFPSELSGGQKQRVAIARAMAVNPKYLILDEPNSALDIKSTKDLINIIKKLNKTITVIIISHSIDFLKKTCSKMAFLYNGKILELQDTKQFFNYPQTTELKEFLKHI